MKRIKIMWLKNFVRNYLFFTNQSNVSITVIEPNPSYNLAELVKLGCKIHSKDWSELTKDNIQYIRLEIPFLQDNEENGLKLIDLWTIQLSRCSKMENHDYIEFYYPEMNGSSGYRICIKTYKGILAHLIELIDFQKGFSSHTLK